MKIKKIIGIEPAPPGFHVFSAFKLPRLGLPILGTILRDKGYQVKLFCQDIAPIDWAELLTADMVMISTITSTAPEAYHIARKIKEKAKVLGKDITIVMGGAHVTFMAEEALENYADFVVRGEGEQTILELLSWLENGNDAVSISRISGLSYKIGTKVYHNEKGPYLLDQDSLPTPELSLIEGWKTPSIFPVLASRGCPFDCAFCPSSVHWGRRIVQRSAKSILDEIKYLLERFPAIKQIYFLDDEFLCNNKRVIDLCKMILEEKINIKWSCLGRASSINDELISWIKKAGCFEVVFGVESGSQRILDNIYKKVKVEQMIDSFRICKKYGIKTKCLTIVGLPGENAKSVNETIKFAKKVKERAEPAILIIYPGTEVCRLAKQKGQLTDDYWLGEGLPPLYTAEHSKKLLWWWSFKTGLITNFYADNGDLKGFLRNKFGRKLSPHTFLRVIKRYISDKT